MPRYLLSRDEKFFNMAFSLLDRKGNVAAETWKLLARLPISPVLYEKILRLDEIRDKEQPNWENILNTKSIYKLLYALHVIEYLMQEGSPES